MLEIKIVFAHESVKIIEKFGALDNYRYLCAHIEQPTAFSTSFRTANSKTETREARRLPAHAIHTEAWALAVSTFASWALAGPEKMM